MGYMLNLVLAGKPAVVIGAGEIAARKVHDLLAANAVVTVIAPAACESIEALDAHNQVTFRPRRYKASDLDGVIVAIAATDDEALNRRVARDAAHRRVLVNVVDRPALCTFTLPAVVRRGDLTIAVATEGRCPALSSILREELEAYYGPEYARLVTRFAASRQTMIARGWNGPRIRRTLAARYTAFLRTVTSLR